MAVASISAVAKTRFYMGGETAGQTKALYEAKTYLEVKDVADIGEIGDEGEIISFKVVDGARVKKAVGTDDAGDFALTVARIEQDAGQQAMRAARKARKNYDFKMVLSNGETFYFTGPVSSNRNQLGGPDEIIQTVFTIAITSEVLEVASV